MTESYFFILVPWVIPSNYVWSSWFIVPKWISQKPQVPQSKTPCFKDLDKKASWSQLGTKYSSFKF